jgi:carbon monoxide dehydrogenase subunit G
MVHLEGDKDFPQTPSALWAKLSNGQFLAECVPGMVSIKDASPESAVVVLRPGFSFVRGTLEVTLRRVEATPETALRYEILGKGIGSSSTVESTLTLAAQEAGTRVHWVADITNLGGLLKAIPQGLIQASAERVILDTWTAIEAKVATGS